MSVAAAPGWSAISAILIAAVVVLWVRWKRRRHFAIAAARRHRGTPVWLPNSKSPSARWHAGSEFDQTTKPILVEVRVLKVDGQFTLLIPLDAGGNELIKCSRGIAEVAGKDLKVTIPDWLSDKMGLEEGSLVQVDNHDGKFNFAAIEARPAYTRRN